MKFKIWPSNALEIHTTLSPEKVLDIFRTNTEPKKLFNMNLNHKYFEGEFSKDGFKINRIIPYYITGFRGSFSPIITGIVIPNGTGSIVKIKMRLRTFTMAFMSIWFLGTILSTLAVIITFIKNPTQVSPIILIPLALIVLGFLLVLGGFYFEATKEQEKIVKLVNG